MKTKILITVLLFTAQLIIAQTVYTVDNRPESGAQHTTVQAAIDAAVAGDIIYIHPSPTSYGNINVTKELKLVGPGHDISNSDGLRATLSNITLRQDSANTIIIGLNLNSVTAYSYGSNTHNIQIINNRITSDIIGNFTDGHSNNWIVEGNYFDSGSYQTISITASNLNNLQVRNNIIKGKISGSNHTNVFTNNLFIHEDTSGDAQIFTSSNGITSQLVTNNMFVFTDPDITALTSTGTEIVYTNCLTWQAGGGADLPALSGSGNINNQDPLFNNAPSLNDFYNNDYTLGAGSPAIGTATDTGDIGIFGRNFPFDINGRPNSMPYPEAMTILNTVVQPGQTLNVEFQATQKN